MARCKLKKRGKPSIEFYDGGKPQYYCYGYIDFTTDELLDECKNCPDHADCAQGDLDRLNGREP